MNVRPILLAGLVSASMALTGFGQEPVDGPSQGGPLAGPRVGDAVVPGVSLQFAENAMTPGRRLQDGLALYSYVDALRTIDLTEAQREAAIDVLRRARQERQAFEAEHAEEIRALRSEARRRGRTRDGTVTDRQPEPPSEEGGEMADLRGRYQALQAQLPPEEPYILELWALLTPEQQVEVEAFLAQRQEEQRQRRMARAGLSPEMMPQTIDQMQPGPSGTRGDAMSPENSWMLRRAGRMGGPRGRRTDDLRHWMEGSQAPPPPTADDIVFDDEP